MTHFRDTQGVDGHSSIDAAPAGALEVSTWSTRSAASMNEVDADERRPIMACRGRSWRPHRERPSWSLKSVYNRAHSLRTPQQKAEENQLFHPLALALDGPSCKRFRTRIPTRDCSFVHPGTDVSPGNTMRPTHAGQPKRQESAHATSRAHRTDA